MEYYVKSIFEKLYVSEASLSRFAKKCGYRGYREFVYQYEETFVEKQESMTGNTRMILDAYQELLNKTYSLVDEAQIARIGRYLNQSDRVFVCGRGSSGLTAKNRGIFEEFCDEIVLLPSLRHLNHGNVISPQFPILVMLDIIYSYYVEQDKFAKELLHDNTLRALGEGEHKRREVME